MSKKNTVVALALFILFASIAAGLFVYNDFLQDNLSAQNCSMLEEIMQQQRYNFDLKLGNDKKTMTTFADLISKVPYAKDSMLDVLNTLVSDSDFDSMTYISPDGKAYNQDGKEFLANDREYFIKALEGKTVISEPLESKVRNANIIVVATPIIKSGEIIGVLAGAYKQEELDKLFLSSFDGAGYAYVTANNGDIIAKTVNSYSLTDIRNIFDFWKRANFYMHDNLKVIKSNLYQNKGGHARYRIDDENRYLHYATITVNDWNIFSVVPEQAVVQTANKILAVSMMLTIGVAVLFSLFSMIGILQQRQYVKTMMRVAFTDELTGAPTLAKFKIEAQRFIDENPEKKLLMVKFDIDRFKLLNRILGFETGDIVIINMCKALKANTPGNYDRYARIHDDEFLVLHEFERQEQVLEIRDRFQDIFKNLMGEDFHYNVKIVSGHYYMQIENCKDISEAIEKANIAHRKARRLGLPLCNYDEQMIEQALTQKKIENKMADALENNEFKVFMQPKYYLSNEKIAGAEALVRWKDSNNNVVYPNDFIPLFEENGFIIKLDIYMFEKVCCIIRRWIDNGITPTAVSVNFSRRHLENINLVEMLCEIADKYEVPRHLLEIELTESTFFDNEEILLTFLDQLHIAGFTLSMDDFGSGYSSLGLLKNIPVDVIKIDRTFLLNSTDDERAKTVIANVMKMARELNIHTVAEGVETIEHIELLRSLDCDIVQGYYYSKPVPVSDFELLL